MSTTIKIILRKKIRKDGTYPIALRITKNQKSKFISLNMFCDIAEFENEQFKRTVPNYKKKNHIILKFKTRALEILDNFILNSVHFTLDDFEEKFRGSNKNQQVTLIVFFNEIIDEMIRAGRISNAKAYQTTRDSLVKFAGDKISFQNVTATFLEKYEVFLREVGNQNGGIAFKMRELRAIYNKARKRKLIPKELYPFEDYKISKLKSKPLKRALTIDEFKKIRDVDLSNQPHLLEAYNYFMFSIYTRGMNFQDMMLLKWSNIQSGRIYYTRSKTKGKFNLEIIARVQEILDYYKAQSRPTDYVFPILLKENLSPQQIANRKHKVLSRYNKKLKEIATLVGISKVLTSYVARHSFATILKMNGTSVEKISEMMGHADVNITMSYLKEFSNTDLDKENRKLMDL